MNPWDDIRDEDCEKCDLYRKAKAVCLMGSGPCPCDTMFIGEAPGKREDDANKVFQNMLGAGGSLNKHLKTLGLDRNSIYITNANKCRPVDKKGKNRTPTIKEMRACRQYLLDEIEAVQPKRIIALGAFALKALMNDARAALKNYRQKRIPSNEFNGIALYCTFHPAAELYDPYVKELVDEDLAFIFGKRKPKKIPRTYMMINGDQKAKEYIQRTDKDLWLSVDFETTGLDHLSPDFELLTVSTCNTPGEAYCYPLQHPGSNIKYWPLVLDKLVPFKWVGHNLKYEMKCLISKGFKLPEKIFDTIIAFHLLDENYPGKSLSNLKRRHTDLGEKEDFIKPYISKLKELPVSIVASYNCEDTDATTRLKPKFERDLEEQGLMPLFNMQMRAVKMFSEIEMNGIRIDIDLLDDNISIFKDKLNEIEEHFPGVNLRSDQQLADYLYNKLKLRMLITTEQGQGSVATDTLEYLSKNTTTGIKHANRLKELIIYKKIDHFDSHFLTGVANQLKGEYIHPNYNMTKHEVEGKGKDMGTVTGRLSASLIHQIPRDTSELNKIFGEDTVQIKEMFISRFEGGCITQADLSQVELRLMAEYAQDENMIEDFEAGIDIHTAVTNRLIPIAQSFYDRYELFKEKRKATKAVNFGIIYGISAFNLASRLDITKKEAEQLIRSWFVTYRKVKRWILRTEKEVMRNGYVVSLIGRRRRLPGASKHTPNGRRILRQAINSPIQGLASDINVHCMEKVNQAFKQYSMESLIIGTVHDSMLTDTHPNEKEDVHDIIEEIYTDPDLTEYGGLELTVPITIDLVQNDTWSSVGEE